MTALISLVYNHSEAQALLMESDYGAEGPFVFVRSDRLNDLADMRHGMHFFLFKGKDESKFRVFADRAVFRL